MKRTTKLKLEVFFPKEEKDLSRQFLSNIRGGFNEPGDGNYSSNTPAYSYSPEFGRDIEKAKER